jgi:hypothetical protein
MKTSFNQWLASCNARLALAWAGYMATAGVALAAALVSLGPTTLLLP